MKEKRNLLKIFTNGIVAENPIFKLVLGTCPTIAITTSAMNGIGMGAAATFVLVGSNAVISMLRKFIPDNVRIPAFIVVICTFVTLVQMMMHAFLPSLYEALGIFIPLIVVNCIILARAESFASKNGVVASIFDGLGMGVGFTLAITLIGSIRELLGAGTLFGLQVMGAGYEPMLLMILAPGGFIVFGTMLGVVNTIMKAVEKKQAEKKDGAA